VIYFPPLLPTEEGELAPVTFWAEDEAAGDNAGAPAASRFPSCARCVKLQDMIKAR